VRIERHRGTEIRNRLHQSNVVDPDFRAVGAGVRRHSENSRGKLLDSGKVRWTHIGITDVNQVAVVVAKHVRGGNRIAAAGDAGRAIGWKPLEPARLDLRPHIAEDLQIDGDLRQPGRRG
jgi:hypothetical protein